MIEKVLRERTENATVFLELKTNENRPTGKEEKRRKIFNLLTLRRWWQGEIDVRYPEMTYRGTLKRIIRKTLMRQWPAGGGWRDRDETGETNYSLVGLMNSASFASFTSCSIQFFDIPGGTGGYQCLGEVVVDRGGLIKATPIRLINLTILKRTHFFEFSSSQYRYIAVLWRGSQLW